MTARCFASKFRLRRTCGLWGVILLVLGASPGSIAAEQRAFDWDELPAGLSVAVFAGGCFWCMEPPFDDVAGVEETIAGYTGGAYERPTYRIVSALDTGHREALLVTYDPDLVSYRELLAIFWTNVNPFDSGGQFCDRGPSYTSAIFFRSASQHRAARASLRAVASARRFAQAQRERGLAVGSGIATAVEPLGKFWIAESEHQDYYIRQPFNYTYYRDRCGREERLTTLWGPSDRRVSTYESIVQPE